MSLTFAEFIERANEAGGLQTDDVLAAFLPLARRVAQWHAQSLVAPPLTPESLELDDVGALRFRGDGGARDVQRNLAAVEAMQRPAVSGLQVVGRARITSDDEHGAEIESLDIVEPGAPVAHPVYIVGYGAWEQALHHHDALTDVFSLGLLLASLALDLDCNDRTDLHAFVAHRNNLFALNPRVHPVVAATILEMTELNRHHRAPDLDAVIRKLATYRDQPVDPDMDVAKLPGFADSAAAGRRALVKTHLRDRLFEISRRNRLLYFKPTQASVNLTVASVPLVVNLHSIHREQLFVWQGELAKKLSAGDALNLGQHLRFEDQPYLSGALDRLIADARRDRAEFGFAQLRLVIAFLQWHNLKEASAERIVSPLLLLPVELTRKKGVRDQYVLEPTSTEAAVNPVLRHHLRQLYGLELPESLELSATTLSQFHEELQRSIRASEPAVTLRLADEPQIELIHERARQRLVQFKRRELRNAPRSPKALDYSYRADDYRPLGLKLFQEKVWPTPLPQRSAAGGLHVPRPTQMVATMDPPKQAGAQTERSTFSVREQREGNPYLWDFDLCSVTLGNFNYRKMSLVRDYGSLIAEETIGAAFDQIFSVDPRPIDAEPPPAPPLAEEWPVVAGDATQRAAVALARTGRSYIIQGPPGTGKSQTITNLIADYIARGKRVLFVCEKRAAIDVVFHRLRQQGLDELCCLIHDSQTDKKSFVLNLKQTYENWLAEPDGAARIESQRAALIKRMQQDLEQLQRFDAAMTAAPEHIGVTVRELVHTLVALRDEEPALTPVELEQLPNYDIWRRHADLAQRLCATLREVCGAHTLAAHPFRALSPALIAADRPLQRLHELADQAEATLDALEQSLSRAALADEHWDTLGEIADITAFAEAAASLASRDQLALLDADSALSRELAAATTALSAAQSQLEQARAQTANWRDKLAAADLDPALMQAEKSENSFFRFLSPGWRRLKAVLASRYDFTSHAIEPKPSQVLRALKAEYAASQRLDELRNAGVQRFASAPDALAASCTELLARAAASPAVDALRARMLAAPDARTRIAELASLAPRVRELISLLPQLLDEFRSLGTAQLGELIRDLREEADALPDLAPVLAELNDAAPAFSAALRRFALSPAAFEAACARKSLEQLYRTERWLMRFDGRALERSAARIAAAEKQWLASNAAALRARLRRTFREHVQISTTSATQLDGEQKQFKKSYAAGRRELEHEFGKSMRYKSIRELAAGDSGRVIRDLKPVWLMSPLSVSDTLPLDTDLFDAVIFDEASQIPVEEAVPALYRAPQIIVVGDEMQLPPTNFFSAARSDDDSEVEVEEDGERVAIALDADSLLTQSARNLPATLLAWHYRSRSESLIGFSNAAFYSGSLYTIPDRDLPAMEQPGISVTAPENATAHTEALLARPLSFHFMEASPYEDRRNPGEAAYIAELVRELLKRETKLSIGVVAFSEAQQSEIERSLDALAAEDVAFGAQLEEAYVREEDDQFCGLFVKNLENVQGDERDIIILSICYGPDASGRMLMNFGPINQRGGEKRLNVIFSRARHHMAVVSSIRHRAITNDYNDGAAALKTFLSYAESASLGDLSMARTVLEGLNPLMRKSPQVRRAGDKAVEQIAAALRERGHVVDEQVGQSRFRCDLAVRSPDQKQYRLGILIDTEDHYANRNVAERYVTRPNILRAFGWEALTIIARDWYHEREAVLERIERKLRGEVEEAEVIDEPAPAEAQAAPQTQPGSTPVSAEDVRRCEFIEGGSAKFWEVRRNDASLTIRFGRIGAQGQTMTKQFDTPELASKELEKLLGEKLRKGYREMS